MSQQVLQFDRESHTFTVAGEVLPSVTTVLKDVGIIDTSQPWYDDYSRDRGTAVHAAIEILDTPGEGGMDWSTVDEPIVGYIRAWQAFLIESGAKILNVERRLWSPQYRFAGIVDRVLLWVWHRTVVDIKTGQPEPWHAIQTAGYQILDGHATARASVYLRKDGKFRVHEHPIRDAADDRSAFLSALSTYYQKRGAA